MSEQTEDEKVLELLINEYGAVDTWETDHWKHMQRLQLELAKNVAETVNEKVRPRKEKAQNIVDDWHRSEDKKLRLQRAVLFSNIDEPEKSELVDFISNSHSTPIEEIKAIYEEPVSRGRGRPKKHSAIDEWICYLEEELGSYRKAAKYVAEHPMLKSKKPVSLNRGNRKYRGGEK